MEYENKIIAYSKLSDKYLQIINNILEYAKIKNILPLKIIIGIEFLKKYINDNKIKLIQYGIGYLLNNKEYLLNFSLDALDELDDISEDNISRKSCMNNINKAKNIIDKNLETEDTEVLNIIIEIKNNAKKLNNKDRICIKKYIELLIICLENIRSLFI